jgi:hypothetical protein
MNDMEIPLYWLFPAAFSCPSFDHPKFSIGFEINMIVIFLNGY